VGTGADTELGHINQMLSGVKAMETPLLRQIEKFGKILTIIILIVCAITFAYGRLFLDIGFVDMFKAVVGVAVSSSGSNRPLIIDQPEDNLDGEFIYSTLVPVLRRAKERRQVIIVTHNPNVAVLSDALEFAAEEEDADLPHQPLGLPARRIDEVLARPDTRFLFSLFTSASVPNCSLHYEPFAQAPGIAEQRLHFFAFKSLINNEGSARNTAEAVKQAHRKCDTWKLTASSRSRWPLSCCSSARSR
jgi:hypothetical protein